MNNDQKFAAEKIRSEYIQKESTELDALRALDAKVKRPANVFAGIYLQLHCCFRGYLCGCVW